MGSRESRSQRRIARHEMQRPGERPRASCFVDGRPYPAEAGEAGARLEAHRKWPGSDRRNGVTHRMGEPDWRRQALVVNAWAFLVAMSRRRGASRHCASPQAPFQPAEFHRYCRSRAPRLAVCCRSGGLATAATRVRTRGFAGSHRSGVPASVLPRRPMQLQRNPPIGACQRTGRPIFRHPAARFDVPQVPRGFPVGGADCCTATAAAVTLPSAPCGISPCTATRTAESIPVAA